MGTKPFLSDCDLSGRGECFTNKNYDTGPSIRNKQVHYILCFILRGCFCYFTFIKLVFEIVSVSHVTLQKKYINHHEYQVGL